MSDRRRKKKLFQQFALRQLWEPSAFIIPSPILHLYIKPRFKFALAYIFHKQLHFYGKTDKYVTNQMLMVFLNYRKDMIYALINKLTDEGYISYVLVDKTPRYLLTALFYDKCVKSMGGNILAEQDIKKNIRKNPIL